MRLKHGYVPSLDGWRGLSVISVILYHGRDGFFKSDSLFMRLSAHGDIGVDVFFAISGFLICGLLLNEYARDGSISLRRFYTRRCFRILPAYYAAVAGITALSVFGVIHVKYSDLPSCLLFYRNYRLLGPDESGGFYTAHFWSLAIEEHFYLVWPMVLLAVKPKRAGRAAFFLAMTVAAWRTFEGHFALFPGILIPSNLLARTDAKVDALLWGCIAAIYFPAIKQYVEGIRFSQLWLPIAAVLLVIEKFHEPGLIVLKAVLIPGLVLSTVIQPGNLLGRMLEWRPLRWIGTISYSLYLWQEIFLPQVASEKSLGVFHYVQQPPWNLLAILACGCISRYLIELPMTRLGHRLSATTPRPGSSHRPTLTPTVAMRAYNVARVEPLQFPDAQCEKDRESLGEDVSDLSRNQVSSSATATDAEPWDSRDGALQAPVIRTSLAANSGPYYAEIKTNILSGLTVALALVPEAIAFALVAHVNPLVGLYAAFIMCLITASFGGRPGMISGATGSTAVVMVALVVQHGIEYLFAAVVLMGILQMIFALFRLGKFIRMVPHPVMLGFVNGLAILIFRAQFGHFKVREAGRGEHWMGSSQLLVMVALVIATMLIIYLFPKVTRAVPPSLAAILVIALVVIFSGIRTKTVGDMASIHGGLPRFHLPAVPWNLTTLWIILPYSLVLAGVGLIETLLTLNLVDDITETRGRPNRECLAQGAANVASGLFASMGGCAMIGQTMINIGSGARRRLSGITAALCLLSFILFASSLIERIPIAALVGVMFVVCEKTFEWGTFKVFGKIPKQDAFVIVAVTVVTVFTNLASAVILGVLIAALVFAWEQAKQLSVQTRTNVRGQKVYELTGTLFFASIAGFHDLFDPRRDPSKVIVDFKHARVVDHSALEAIDRLAQRYQQAGKHLHLLHLSPDCYELLQKAKATVEINLREDPRYHVADDQIS